MRVRDPCQAPRWLTGGHAQAVYPALFLRGPVGCVAGAFPGKPDWQPQRLLALSGVQFFGERLHPLR